MQHRKKLIFTVTTGRSGTMFLSSILRLLKDVDCFHEPGNLFNSYFRKVQENPAICEEFWNKIKLPLVNSYPNSTYIETSHFFCKGFFEPLVDLGHVPHLILLTRKPREVAKSMYRLNTIPGRTAEGILNYLSPDDKDVLYVRNWQELTDYQLCYWYCLEIERRQKLYKEQITRIGGKALELSFKDLVEVKPALIQLTETFELPSFSPIGALKYYYKRLIPQKVNQKIQLKINPELDVLYGKEEQELLKRIQLEEKPHEAIV